LFTALHKPSVCAGTPSKQKLLLLLQFIPSVLVPFSPEKKIKCIFEPEFIFKIDFPVARKCFNRKHYNVVEF
jgi:hypothetical protein